MNPSASGMSGAVAGTVRRLGRSYVDLLFPPACANCQTELPGEGLQILLCDRCTLVLAPMDERRCPRCAMRLPLGVPLEADCTFCRGHRQHFEAAWVLGEYVDQLRASVLRCKRPPGQVLARQLAALAVRRHGEALAAWRADVVIPTPLHWLRRLGRGANGPETVAERLARALRVPAADHAIRRVRWTSPQARLPAPERRRNVRGAFRARRTADFQGARVLLVDDILTTGATLNELAAVCRAAGAAAVAAFALARAHGP